MYALLPNPLASRLPSSQGTSPEASQETMIRAASPMSHAEEVQPSTPPARITTPATSPVLQAPNHEPTSSPTSSTTPTAPAAQADVTPPAGALQQPEESESRSKSGDFLYFLDTMSEEIEYHEGRVDILIYKGHDMRRETPSNRTELNQWWVCRHQVLHKCLSKLLLSVANLDDITKGSHVIEYVEHSHAPFRMRSYGLTNVSVLQASDERVDAQAAHNSLNFASSRLNSGEFSGDFNSEAMDARIQSTPAERVQPVKGGTTTARHVKNNSVVSSPWRPRI